MFYGNGVQQVYLGGQRAWILHEEDSEKKGQGSWSCLKFCCACITISFYLILFPLPETLSFSLSLDEPFYQKILLVWLLIRWTLVALLEWFLKLALFIAKIEEFWLNDKQNNTCQPQYCCYKNHSSLRESSLSRPVLKKGFRYLVVKNTMYAWRSSWYKDIYWT